MLHWGSLLAMVWLAQGVAQTKVLQEWDFAEGLQGWQPNSHLAEVQVKEGIVSGRAIQWDPFFTSPLFEIPANPWQAIEVRLKADRSGQAEFFWTNTTQTQYGGFSPEKRTPFEVLGDGQWHVYRVQPFWQAEGRVIRLRFDLYAGVRFEVDWIRIVEPKALPKPTTATEFRLGEQRAGWLEEGMEDLGPGREGWRWRATSSRSQWVAPPVSWPAEEALYATLRLRATAGEGGVVLAATDRRNGLREVGFRLRSDGEWHIYNVPIGGGAQWEGKVVYLALRPTDALGAEVEVAWVRVGPGPSGPADVVLQRVGFEAGILRAGLPVPVVAQVFNQGGEAAREARALLHLGPTLRLVEGAREQSLPEPLEAFLEHSFRWQVEATQPGEGWVEVELQSPHAPSQRQRLTDSFTARPPVPQFAYVPEPRPVRSEYQIGVYYFPGWATASQWAPIRRFPERTPTLGFYREGDPEVADWHIKWAVEHGISFFIYDWYWVQGARSLEHALHDGFLRARYQHLLKFCLLWANHNPPNTSSEEDLLNVTDFWLEHYFHRENYLKVDGKPMVVIFSPYRLRADMGSEAVRTAFEKMRARCRQAGFAGLYLVACGAPGQEALLVKEGYDAISGYNWPRAGMQPGEGNRSPFHRLLEGYREMWGSILREGLLPLIPPVSGGWDSRPWHGEGALVRYGRTPELFRRHLQDVKALLDQGGPLLPYKMAFIEAWNEWGEGSYIEPHQEFGFDYLDAIREVFTDAPKEHVDLAPVDVGLGPYDVPPMEYKRAWEFETDTEGWESVMQMTRPQVRGGALVATSLGHDPAFFGPPTLFHAQRFPTVRIRMRVSRDDVAQLFWRTHLEGESEATSQHFPVKGDGEFHEYVLDLGKHPRWRGIVTRLRLDPCSQPGVEVAVDFIRCEP